MQIDLFLLLNALIVLTVGFVSGAPMGMAIYRNENRRQDSGREWSLA